MQKGIFIIYFYRIKAQDMVIRQQGQVIVSLKEEVREMKELINNGNSNVNTKLNKILNHLNVTASGGGSSDVMVIEDGVSSNTIEVDHIKVVPDWFGYLKPLLTTKSVSTAICEYLTHESYASYKKFVTAEQNKTEKHVMKVLKLITELVRGFIPSGYPKFDGSGMTHSGWKSHVLNITKVGLKTLTEFVTDSGIKQTRGPVSKSWLVKEENVKPINVEIQRRKRMVKYHNVDESFPQVSDNFVGTANAIVESENVDVSENLELPLFTQVLEGDEKLTNEQKVETTKNKVDPHLKEAIMMKTVSEMRLYLKEKSLKSSGNKIILADRIHAYMDIDEAVAFIATLRVKRKRMTKKKPQSEIEVSMHEKIGVGPDKDEPQVNEDNLGTDDDIVSDTGQDILIEDV